jgi:NitT/TauT family transport system substrate-binding protein
MCLMQSRRRFVGTTAAAGAAALMGEFWPALADEGPPETTTIKLAYYSNDCLAPLLVAEELLHAEGFTDIHYVSVPKSFTIPELVAGHA